MSVIRCTSLTGYSALVDELGGDPDVLLSRAGIQRAAEPAVPAGRENPAGSEAGFEAVRV